GVRRLVRDVLRPVRVGLLPVGRVLAIGLEDVVLLLEKLLPERLRLLLFHSRSSPSTWALLRLASISPDPVASALLPQRLPADPEYGGRPRLAPAGRVQHVADVGLLHVLERGAPVPARPERRRLLQDRGGKRGRRHGFPRRVEGGALDHGA